jgi:hypothetical protein
MNQHHPRQDGSRGHAGTRSGITRQDLIRKALYLATRHRPKACEVLTPATGRLHRRQLATVHPAGSQMTTASTGLATMAHQELTATSRAAVIRPGDRGHDRLLQSWDPRC